MEIVGIVTCLTAFLITLIFIPVVRRISKAIEFVDEPGERKVHKEPIPLGGGIAIFLGVILTFSLAIVSAYFLMNNPVTWLPKEIYDYLPGVFKMIPTLSIIFLGGTGMFLLGLLDDIKRLGPYTKLSAQIIIALFLVLNGISFSLFLKETGLTGRLISGGITVLWIVAVTNSFNLLDHMDGLSSGIAAIVSTVFLIIAVQTGQYFIACFLLTIIGVCLAFLIFNFHPARIFMGDTGSLFVGYLIAALTVLFTFYKANYSLYAIITPLLVVAIPLFDTAVVVFIRIKNRKPIFKGDMNHFAHRLIGMGMSVSEAVLSIYLLTFCAGLSAILLYHINPKSGLVGSLIVAGQVILLLAIITILENTGRRNKNNT
ncbi:MAG: undecaprenyl/decaprenyl-phosphate alpha-N-acetylglucosaminyl 1-phosphate transferase [Planctomycetes bacterium]|nr:undecaprenyl/decaprenyl-phosphate alpha-N-acetylglucosaminyl 1-phosphate transferase [Planctomycetota bacterium]